jgi:hypothetical protein|tara:strand:+ start:240 stop:542 length:303 start_codon:yes stop_codon:yes gene_type:complete
MENFMIEKYSVNYCSNNNWDVDDEGNYVDSDIHMETNEDNLCFDTEKEAIEWVRRNEPKNKLDLFYIRINRIHITEERIRTWREIDESYDPIFLEDLEGA